MGISDIKTLELKKDYKKNSYLFLMFGLNYLMWSDNHVKTSMNCLDSVDLRFSKS